MLQMLNRIIFPNLCLLCQEQIPHPPDTHLCSTCNRELKHLQAPYCPKCGGSTDTALELCRECLHLPRPWCHAISIFSFNGRIQKTIHRFKYHRDSVLTRFFAQELYQAYHRHFNKETNQIDAIVSVPLHWRREFSRGFNQSILLSKAFSSLAQIPHYPALKRIKATHSQSSLDRKNRQKNVQNAFRVKNNFDIHGMRVLLCDDVFTTGSTLMSCTRELYAAGVQSVQVITLARG